MIVAQAIRLASTDRDRCREAIGIVVAALHKDHERLQEAYASGDAELISCATLNFAKRDMGLTVVVLRYLGSL